jgi:hypothetical protein
MAERKRLSDILLNSERERLGRVWDTTAPADDLKPLPPGEYRCRVADGALFTARSGTPGYKVTLEVLDGDHAGRRVWLDVWLSEAALPMAKRDLAKLGIDRPEQLESPLPPGLIVAAKVALRRGEDGQESNRVTRFELVAVEPPGPDPFAPRMGEADDAARDRGEAHDGADDFDWQSGTGSRNGVPTP